MDDEEKLMRKLRAGRICIPAFLLAAVLAGCGDPDKNAGNGNPGDPLTPPTVTSVTPPDGSGPVCPNNAVVTATFSKAMNPATITGSTFTVTVAGSGVPFRFRYAVVKAVCAAAAEVADGGGGSVK